MEAYEMHSVSRLQCVISSLVLAASLGAFPSAIAGTTQQYVVRMKERTPIEQLAKSVTDPSSPRYGKFYSPEEIRALCAPSDADFNAVVDRLKATGMTIVNVSKSHLFVTLQGTAEQAQKLDGSTTSDSHTQIAAISGLERNHGQSRKAFPKYIIRGKGMTQAMSALMDDDHGHGGIAPETIKTAYGFNPIYAAGITGKGQHIAIATYDSFNVDDVNQYFAIDGITPAPIVDQINFNGTAVLDDNSALETQLDAEFSGAIAPGAQIHVFTSAANSDAGEVALFTAILDDNRAKVANYSWGSCEAQVSAAHHADMDKVFARAIAQGVNIMVASGDSGSASCPGDSSTQADWPAAHPNVIAVGGTTLSISTPARDDSASEQGWNMSGGGISSYYGPAAYQSGLAAPFNANRSYPDVAFNADPNSGQALYGHNQGTLQWIAVGGTSIAAPQWAGYMALVGEARGAKPALGSLSAALYAFSGAEQTHYMRDVLTGNNGAYSCNAGWDAVTGWGSMHAAELLKYLAAH